ncbi:MAG: hypothetical protein WCS16_01040, partial [Desulfuromonas sp.]
HVSPKLPSNVVQVQVQTGLGCAISWRDESAMCVIALWLAVKLSVRINAVLKVSASILDIITMMAYCKP